jgi:hypothetical protein
MTATELVESSCLCLVRVNSTNIQAESPPVGKNIIPLFQGAILGRTSDRTKRSSRTLAPTAVNLGIDAASAPGVSRNQLHVIQVDPGVLTVHQPPTVINPVGIARYSATNGTRTVVEASSGERLQVFPDDIIIFDFFRQDKNHVSVGPPKHLFLVVSLEQTLTKVNRPVPTSASSAFDELQQNTSLSSASNKGKANTSRSTQRNNNKKQQSTRSTSTKKRYPSPTSPSPVDSNDETSPGSSPGAEGKKLLDTFENMVDKEISVPVASVSAAVPHEAADASASNVTSAMPPRIPRPDDRVRVWFPRGARGW